jgi:hypothetical protein
MTPRDCPRFDACSAAICPLDASWPKAVHLNGEPVCSYLLCSGKQGAALRFADDPVFEACRVALPLVAAKHPLIRRAVERAARSGFKDANLVRTSGSSGNGGVSLGDNLPSDGPRAGLGALGG